MTEEEVIKALENMIIYINSLYETYKDNDDCVTRHSIIKTKLDEIKDMFEDPVTNEELIEILEEEGDNQ